VVRDVLEAVSAHRQEEIEAVQRVKPVAAPAPAEDHWRPASDSVAARLIARLVNLMPGWDVRYHKVWWTAMDDRRALIRVDVAPGGLGGIEVTGSWFGTEPSMHLTNVTHLAESASDADLDTTIVILRAARVLPSTRC
jgi:hypothetical protein